MKSLSVLLVPLCLGVLSTNAQQQRGHMPTPPIPLNSENANTPTDQKTLTRRVDLARLEQEADELARTAQTIPADLASVRKGMLPKDVVQKLKQIEKMSKHLRSELNP